MKQNLKLLLLLLIIGSKPIQAAVLGGEPVAPQGNTPPSSSPANNKNQGNSTNPVTNALSESSPKMTGAQAVQPLLPHGGPMPLVKEAQQLANQPSQLTPQQTQQLIEQTKNLNPDQLQAIAKTIQSQATQAENPQSQESLHVGVQQTSTAPAPSQPAKERPIDIEEMKREAAFNSLMSDVLPLSPDQIMKLHKFYDLTLQAKATPVAPPPNPNFTSIVVTLDPGSQPPVIRLSAGFVTSVLFVDTTGAAWPITAYSIGDPQGFNIQWDQKGNALFVQSLKQYAHGNLAVRLWGLDTPVMITLVSGQKNVDFRVDLQVMGRGPDAKPPIVDTTLSAKVNPLLINILDGIPPRDSIKLGVSGGYGDAWFVDGRVYFRTKLTVLSPAWTATVASPDGTHVYEMMQTPFILATLNGRTVDIKLSGL